jgi:hypothetical protein
MVKKQVGSGFTFNQSDVIGGQMARVSYSDCDSPSYYNKFQVYDVNPSVQQSAGGKRAKKSKKVSRSSGKKSRKTVNKSKKKSNLKRKSSTRRK